MTKCNLQSRDLCSERAAAQLLRLHLSIVSVNIFRKVIPPPPRRSTRVLHLILWHFSAEPNVICSGSSLWLMLQREQHVEKSDKCSLTLAAAQSQPQCPGIGRQPLPCPRQQRLPSMWRVTETCNPNAMERSV